MSGVYLLEKLAAMLGQTRLPLRLSHRSPNEIFHVQSEPQQGSGQVIGSLGGSLLVPLSTELEGSSVLQRHPAAAR